MGNTREVNGNAAAGNFITAVALSAATEAGSVVKVQLIKAGYKPKE